MATSRKFAGHRDTPRTLVRAGAAGLIIGVTLFVGALFVYTPTAPAARVLGADGRLVGIPKNCDVARAARVAPMARGSGYYAERLDGDHNGLACEPKKFGIF